MSAANRWWRDYDVECLLWLRALPWEQSTAILVGSHEIACGDDEAMCAREYYGLMARLRLAWETAAVFERKTCPGCDELVMPWDQIRKVPHMSESGLSTGTWHRECLIRGVVGSVGHQSGKCSCYGGIEEDPPGMSKREAAIAACIKAGIIRPDN